MSCLEFRTVWTSSFISIKMAALYLGILTYIVCGMMTCAEAETHDSYMRRRGVFRSLDDKFRYGERVDLTDPEEAVNRRLIAVKTSEFRQGMTSGTFSPGRNFMEAVQKVEKSAVFRMIKRMPKGCALHAHLVAMIDPAWVIANVTYRQDCFMCINSRGGVRFQISRSTPTVGVKNCTFWQKVNDVRERYKSPAIFDDALRLNMTILSNDPETDYPDINVVWQKADKTWPALGDLIYFKDVLPTYMAEVMRQYLVDGVQYFETRGSLYATYDYDRKYTVEQVIIIMRDAVQRFKRENPTFIGARYIMEMSKVAPKDEIGQAVEAAVALHRKYPDFVAGFDLVAQEDATNPILYYLDELLLPSQMQPPYKLPYFLHAGETNWEGSRIDANLYDAILLNSTRIGHGYAAVKHPQVLTQLREKDVAVEVNPISNQVLLLVDDLRNHPASYLLANNYSIVVSSDDPGIWGALPLSHDVYELFMGCVPMDEGLRVLKRLAMDSIRYSSMNGEEKAEASSKWLLQWNKFILRERQLHHSGLEENFIRRSIVQLT